MSSAATSAWDPPPPLERARCYLDLFGHLFSALFQPPVARYIARKAHGAASAWLRAVEAFVRSVLLVEAARLAPNLPAPRRAARKSPRPAAQAAARPRKPRDPHQPPRFCVFRAADFRYPVKRPPKARPAPTSAEPRAPGLGDLRPLIARYESMLQALDHPEAYIRRAALRLQALKAASGGVQIFRSPRVRPDYRGYIENDLHILREDANEALRDLFWSSG